MSATIAVDILAGAINLSPAQERVLRESQGYVRGGTQASRPTREVLKRLGLIEQAKDAPGWFTTAWGDAVGEELVAREAAKGEPLLEISWAGSYGQLAGGRFSFTVEKPGSYALLDNGKNTGHTFTTLVHLRQAVAQVLADEAREMAQITQPGPVDEAKLVSHFRNECPNPENCPTGEHSAPLERAVTRRKADQLLDRLVCEELIDNVRPMDLRPGDRITGIDGEWFPLGEGPVVAEKARRIYGDSGPWGVRLLGSRTVVEFLYVENVDKVSVSRPCHG